MYIFLDSNGEILEKVTPAKLAEAYRKSLECEACPTVYAFAEMGGDNPKLPLHLIDGQ